MSDFTKEDQGRYRPPAARKTILDSLEQTKYQSSRHLCMNTGLPIEEVLSVVDVESDEKIDQRVVGGVIVYFLKKNAPAGRLVNSGDNSFRVVADEKPAAPRDTTPAFLRANVSVIAKFAEEGKSQKELAAALGIDYNLLRHYLSADKVTEARDAWRDGKKRALDLEAIRAKAERAKVGKRPGGRRTKITPEQVEDCAFDGLSHADAAKRLGLSESTFKAYIQQKQPRPDLREAWQRGKARHKELIKSMKPEKAKINHNMEADAAAAGDYLGQTKPAEPVIVNDVDREPITFRASDVLMTVGAPVEEPILELPPLADASIEVAYDPPVPPEPVEEVAVEQRFEHTINHVIQHGRSRKSIEKVKADLLATKPMPALDQIRISVDEDLPPARPAEYYESHVGQITPHHKAVSLSGGSFLRVESDLNIFDSDPDELALLSDISSRIRKFEEDRQKTAEYIRNLIEV